MDVGVTLAAGICAGLGDCLMPRIAAQRTYLGR